MKQRKQNRYSDILTVRSKHFSLKKRNSTSIFRPKITVGVASPLHFI